MNKIGTLGIIAIAVILVFVIAAVAVTVEGAGKTKAPAKKNVKPISGQPTKQPVLLLAPAPMAAASCTDPDGGLGYFQSSCVSGVSSYGCDGCWDPNSVNATGNTLRELYCDSDGEVAFKDYDCTSGGWTCQNGACV